VAYRWSGNWTKPDKNRLKLLGSMHKTAEKTSYLTAWAAGIARTGQATVRALVSSYSRAARDQKATKADRDFARRRAQALRRRLRS